MGRADAHRTLATQQRKGLTPSIETDTVNATLGRLNTIAHDRPQPFVGQR